MINYLKYYLNINNGIEKILIYDYDEIFQILETTKKNLCKNNEIRQVLLNCIYVLM